MTVLRISLCSLQDWAPPGITTPHIPMPATTAWLSACRPRLVHRPIALFPRGLRRLCPAGSGRRLAGERLPFVFSPLSLFPATCWDMAPFNKGLSTCPVLRVGPEGAPCKNADIIHCLEPIQNRVALPRPPASKKHLLLPGWTEPTHSFPSGCPVLLYWPSRDL